MTRRTDTWADACARCGLARIKHADQTATFDWSGMGALAASGNDCPGFAEERDVQADLAAVEQLGPQKLYGMPRWARRDGTAADIELGLCLAVGGSVGVTLVDGSGPFCFRARASRRLRPEEVAAMFEEWPRIAPAGCRLDAIEEPPA